jgi:uncharacterized protein (DUF488 family)
MINRIFATGYAEQDINNLKPLVEGLDTILVDIRFAPYSKEMFWRKVFLKTLLGDKYLHIANLGNRSFKESDKCAIQNLQLGIETLLGLNMDSILFCVCSARENCHRRVIAEELQKRGIEIIEIPDWTDFRNF